MSTVLTKPTIMQGVPSVKCLICKKLVSSKDIALAWRSKEYTPYGTEMSLVKAMHKMCVSRIFDQDDILMDNYDMIKQQLADGVVFYER